MDTSDKECGEVFWTESIESKYNKRWASIKEKNQALMRLLTIPFCEGAAEFFPARFRILYGTEEFK